MPKDVSDRLLTYAEDQNNVPIHGMRPSTSIESLPHRPGHNTQTDGGFASTPTPDGVLNAYGATNPYQLFIFVSMALVWTFMALPLLVSAFFLGDICLDERNCTLTPGSLIEEFRLVGAKSYLADGSTMAFVFGNMLGASLISRFSDLKGRRPALVLSMLGVGLFGMLSAACTDVYTFILNRFLQGFFVSGCGITNWVLAYESTAMRLRAYAALVFGLLWVVGYVVLAPVCYALPSWRHQMVAASLPCALFGALYAAAVPESFHHLAARGRGAALRRWYARANRWASPGRRRDPAEADALVAAARAARRDAAAAADRGGFLCALAARRALLLHTAVLAYLWSCDSFVYYGLSLISTTLAGNRYLNFALAGLVEIPSYIVSPYLLERMGRRGFVSFIHLLTAMAFLGTICIDHDSVSFAFWMVGKFGIACAYTSLYVYGSEVFPTVLRGACIGTCLFLERIGGITAPTVRSMSVISPNLPNLFFAIAAGLAALLTLLLPETRGRELPDLTSEVAELTDRKLSEKLTGSSC